MTPSALDLSDLRAAPPAPQSPEATEPAAVLVAVGHQTDTPEPIASSVSDLAYGSESHAEVAPSDATFLDGAESRGESESAPSFPAPDAVTGFPFDAAVEAEDTTPRFEVVEAPAGPDAEWIMAEALDAETVELSAEAWPQGGWQTPSIEEIRVEAPQAIEASPPSVQAVALEVVGGVEEVQVESSEQTGAVSGSGSVHDEPTFAVDVPHEEPWTGADLLMREVEGDDDQAGEVAEGEEMETTPFDHVTGDRLSVLVERGPESLDALVDATEAQARAVDVLEALARRLRSGDLAVAAGSGTSAESVLASILAALLSERP